MLVMQIGVNFVFIIYSIVRAFYLFGTKYHKRYIHWHKIYEKEPELAEEMKEVQPTPVINSLITVKSKRTSLKSIMYSGKNIG